MFWQMLIWIAFAGIAHYNFSVMRNASGPVLTYGNDMNAAAA